MNLTTSSTSTRNLWQALLAASLCIAAANALPAVSAEQPSAMVCLHGKCSFIDIQGKRVFAGEYDGAGGFSEGMAAVRVKDLWGFIDKTGTLRIAPRFDAVGNFSEGLAIVKVAERYGFVDASGRVVIEPAFADAGMFSNGLALVKVGEKYGYIDKSGTIRIAPQFDTATAFKEGFAAVSHSHKTHYIDPAGDALGTVDLSDGAGLFSNGLAVVQINGKWGYIDTSGRVAIDPTFDEAQDFSEGVAVVGRDHHYWLIDRGGKSVMHPRYSNSIGCQGFKVSEGLLSAQLGTECVYLDSPSDNVAIRIDVPWLSSVAPFSERMARVQMAGGACGYLNRRGQIVISPQFDYCTDFTLPDDRNETFELHF